MREDLDVIMVSGRACIIYLSSKEDTTIKTTIKLSYLEITEFDGCRNRAESP